jgi:hypothetical protein
VRARSSLQGIGGVAASDPLLHRLFAGSCWPAISKLAEAAVADDLYGDRRRLEQALALAGGDAGDVLRVVEHHLWCAWRDARRAVCPDCLDALDVEVRGAGWLAETEGRPVVLVAPMTAPIPDTIEILCQRIFAGRPVVFFGEGVSSRDFDALPPNGAVADDDHGAVARIRQVLAQGGVYCTYADFAYGSRRATLMPFFGGVRPVSTGFLALAGQPGTMLLPATGVRTGERSVVFHVDEPTLIEGSASASDRLSDEDLAGVAALVGGMLEDLIGLDPAQWLLLPTLTYDAPQQARVESPP